LKDAGPATNVPGGALSSSDGGGEISPAWLAALGQRVAAWRGVELTVAPLGGGITNRNFRVVAGGQAFVLRIGGNATGKLGIDREVEHAASLLASAVGIGPEVIAFLRPEGYLVTRFVEGLPVAPELVRTPAVLARIAAALRRFHQGTPIPGSFSAFQVVERYAGLAQELAAPLPTVFAPFLEQARRMEAALYPLGKDEAVAVPCHNDLLNANFLRDAVQLWILDWEYAGMGDRYFDLGNLSANHQFSEREDHALLAAYFDLSAPDPARFARLRLMRGMSLFREAMWGVAQQGLSNIDFDFAGYSERHFRLLGKWLARSSYTRWLAETCGPE